VTNETDVSEDKEKEKDNILIFPDFSSGTIPKTLGVYGEIDEDRSKVAVSLLYLVKKTAQTEKEVQEKEDEEHEPPEPVDFLISTEGGDVQEMFSIYDCMRDVQKDCEIHTFGVGKVMSAGILLLAAGTKGKRRVGKHCRLMMHSVQGGHFGSIKELETDIREVRWYQDQFIKSIVEETNLDRREIKNIFRRKTDTYFDAEQAVEWGIADEVV